MNEPARIPPPAAPEEAEILELRRPRRKGIYVLPNAVTLGALFAGFYAIVMAMSGRFEVACIGIFVAAVLDSLDGRIARMTNTQSAFGEQMDSLCDMVSFGLAPALIMLEWGLKGLGKPGWIAAFVYCAAAALRLARFNVNIGVVDKRFFQGLPSPAAAALVIGFIYVMTELGIGPVGKGDALAWAAFGVTLYAGLSMVTNAPFYSFKSLGGRRTVPFAVIVAVALGIAVVNIHPPIVLFAVYLVYAWRRLKGKPASVIATSTDEPDEIGLHR
jgi:CDP-diacylglycerol---serine O-phosphatidyltransferase